MHRRCMLPHSPALRLLITVLASTLPIAATVPQPPAAAKVFLATHCAACHQSSKAPAGIDLTSLPFNLEDTHTFNQWVRVYDAVRSGQMPPGGRSSVAEPARKAFLSVIGTPMTAYE